MGGPPGRKGILGSSEGLRDFLPPEKELQHGWTLGNTLRRRGPWGSAGLDVQEPQDPPGHRENPQEKGFTWPGLGGTLQQGGSWWGSGDQDMGSPQGGGGSASLNLGDTLGRKGGPRGIIRARHGGTPERGAHLSRKWGDIPGRKGGAQLGWTWEPPLRKGGSPVGDLGDTLGGGEHGESPQERKGLVCVDMSRHETPQKHGGPAGQDVGSPQERAGLSSAGQAKEGPPGMGTPQERGFSFPGHRRTQTQVSHRGSRSS